MDIGCCLLKCYINVFGMLLFTGVPFNSTAKHNIKCIYHSVNYMQFAFVCCTVNKFSYKQDKTKAF